MALLRRNEWHLHDTYYSNATHEEFLWALLHMIRDIVHSVSYKQEQQEYKITIAAQTQRRLHILSVLTFRSCAVESGLFVLCNSTISWESIGKIHVRRLLSGHRQADHPLSDRRLSFCQCLCPIHLHWQPLTGQKKLWHGKLRAILPQGAHTHWE
jgi:hypothetical protein